MSLLDLAQTAICAASHAHGGYLSFDLSGPHSLAARKALAQLAEQLDAGAGEGADARNCWAIGIGADVWPLLVGDAGPAELAPFPAFDDAIHANPVTPHAVFVHLRSDRHDACFIAGELAQQALAGYFALVDARSGFRYRDSRDLTGFVDGTENPAQDERPAAALLDDGSPYAGGSFLHVQRYVHDLAKWRRTPVATQERTIGRTKQDNVEMDDDIKPPTSHIARTVIEEDGEELEILRQSLPYGEVGAEQGLMFLSYCKTPTIFTRMLERMVTRRDGHSDHMLHFTTAVTGAAYFVPPRAMLTAWAG